MNLKESLLSTSRLNKKLLALLSDFLSMFFAILLALVVSDVEIYSINLEKFLWLLRMPLLCVITFWYFGVYNSVVRYINLTVILVLAKAIFLAFALGLIGKFLYIYLLSNFIPRIPDSLFSFEGWLVGFITLASNTNRCGEKNDVRSEIESVSDLRISRSVRVKYEKQPRSTRSIGAVSFQ